MRAAGSNGFGGLFHFDETHPAIACNFESFVVAEAWDLDSILFGSLEDGEVVIDLRLEEMATW